MLEEDTDDEWFINSIYRYKELIMFDMGDSVYQLEVCDSSRVCTLSERGPGRRIISLLSLPSKVSRNSTNLITKENTDIKILAGFFPNSNPKQILAVYERQRLISSHEDIKGVVLYSMKDCDSDQILLDTTLSFPLWEPNLELVEENQLVLSKFTPHPCLVGDLNTGAILNSIKVDDTNDTINPKCIDLNCIALSLKKAGISYLFDRRNNSVNQKIYVSEGSDTCWSVFTDYVFYKKTESAGTSVHFLSNSGSFKCYDLRNLSSAYVNCKLPLSTKTSDNLKIHFNPDNKDVLSVSGFDDSIYVYNIKNEMTEVFRHDGHSKTDSCAKETTISDHFWYSDEFVISSAFNNSINCWIANVNFNNVVV